MNYLLKVALFLRKDAHSYKLTLSQKCILTNIAAHIGNNESWYIKQTELAQECQLSIQAIKKGLFTLCSKNILLIEKINTKTGKQSVYKINNSIFNFVSQDIPSDENTRYTPVDQGEGTTSTYVYQAPDTRYTPVDQVPVLIHSPSETPSAFQEVFASPKETLKQINIKSKETRGEKIVLPDCISQADWDDFLNNRKSMKSPMSPCAQKRAINQLIKFHEEGQDVKAIIDQSIINGWKGVFPVRNFSRNSNGRPRNTIVNDRGVEVTVSPQAFSFYQYYDALNGTNHAG